MIDLLHQDESPMPILWTQRFKANLAKLVSGDIYKVEDVTAAVEVRR